ncbi:hypothetical protein QGU_3844 [Clostridioides difficile 655]|nr:hypothetical protein QGU_3844 [Clostridioides difficile 655]
MGVDNLANYKKFKYISCYCLTSNLPIYHAPENAFKYISCYCLTLVVLQQFHLVLLI